MQKETTRRRQHDGVARHVTVLWSVVQPPDLGWDESGRWSTRPKPTSYPQAGTRRPLRRATRRGGRGLRRGKRTVPSNGQTRRVRNRSCPRRLCYAAEGLRSANGRLGETCRRVSSDGENLETCETAGNRSDAAPNWTALANGGRGVSGGGWRGNADRDGMSRRPWALWRLQDEKLEEAEYLPLR